MLNRSSFKVSIFEAAKRIWETKIGICFRSSGKLLHLKRVQTPQKNLSVVEQLNADERAPEVLTPADLLDLVLFWGVSTCCILLTCQSPRTGRSPKTWAAEDTVQKHSCESQPTQKCPKIFSKGWNHVFGSYFQQNKNLYDTASILDLTCNDPNVCVAPKLICWNLDLQKMVLSGAAFGRCSGHEGE